MINFYVTQDENKVKFLCYKEKTIIHSHWKYLLGTSYYQDTELFSLPLLSLPPPPSSSLYTSPLAPSPCPPPPQPKCGWGQGYHCHNVFLLSWRWGRRKVFVSMERLVPHAWPAACPVTQRPPCTVPAELGSFWQTENCHILFSRVGENRILRLRKKVIIDLWNIWNLFQDPW